MSDNQEVAGVDPELLKNPLFQQLMAEGLAIQDRFSAEPVYANTGKGYLRSAGVEELQLIKEKLLDHCTGHSEDEPPARSSRPCP